MASIPVLFVPFTGVPVPDNMALLKRKREALWNNVDRNKLLVEVAVEVSRKPRNVLRNYGVDAESVHLPPERVRQRVVILVEGVEHAERLKRLLPAWEVQHAIPLEREPDDVEEDEHEPLPPGVIATLISVVTYGIKCDVLVRATGGTGHLGWDRIRGIGRIAAPALVIDVNDQSDGRSRTDAEVRRREYRQQGLKILETGVMNQNT